MGKSNQTVDDMLVFAQEIGLSMRIAQSKVFEVRTACEELLQRYGLKPLSCHTRPTNHLNDMH